MTNKMNLQESIRNDLNKIDEAEEYGKLYQVEFAGHPVGIYSTLLKARHAIEYTVNDTSGPSQKTDISQQSHASEYSIEEVSLGQIIKNLDADISYDTLG